MGTGESMLYKHGLATPIKHQLGPVKYSYLWQRAMVFSGLYSLKTAIVLLGNTGWGSHLSTENMAIEIFTGCFPQVCECVVLTGLASCVPQHSTPLPSSFKSILKIIYSCVLPFL